MGQAAVGTWSVVSEFDDFLSLKEDWERLFFLNPRHSPFLAWGWVAAWLRHLAGDYKLKIIVMRNIAGALEIVIPLICKKQGVFRKELYMFACSEGPDCSDYLDCLRAPAHEADLADLVTTGIGMLPDDASVRLSALDSQAGFTNKLLTQLNSRGRRARLLGDFCCPRATLPTEWDEFLQQLSRNFRWQVKRHHKRIIENPDLRFRQLECHEAEDFSKILVKLNRRRMSAKGEKSSLENSKFREFIVESIPYMASRQLAWMDVVEKNSIVIAAALNFMHGSTVYYYMGGFDDDSGEIRPGTALFAEVIKRSIQSGYRNYDFLRGREAYKYRWSAEDRVLSKLDIYPRVPIRGTIFWAADAAENALRKSYRRILEKMARSQSRT